MKSGAEGSTFLDLLSPAYEIVETGKTVKVRQDLSRSSKAQQRNVSLSLLNKKNEFASIYPGRSTSITDSFFLMGWEVLYDFSSWVRLHRDSSKVIFMFEARY